MALSEETYKQAMERPLQVFEVFKDFFGEEMVDLQGFPSYSRVSTWKDMAVDNLRHYIYGTFTDTYILVYFPLVKVSNEHNKYVWITELYVKVPVDIYGKTSGRFMMARGEYTATELACNYMHSHISGIPWSNPSEFLQPCTGSGPINNTICSLVQDFDLDIWRLYCLELDKFVQTESLTGGPYHRLESLVRGGRRNEVPINSRVLNHIHHSQIKINALKPLLPAFTKYLIDKEVLPFTYKLGEYEVALSSLNTYITVSNCFIEWYNKQFNDGVISTSVGELVASGTIIKCTLSDGKLFRPSSNASNAYQCIGQFLCNFKGREVRIKLRSEESNDEENQISILDPTLIAYIITKILNVINYRYGNPRSNEENSPGERVYFL